MPQERFDTVSRERGRSRPILVVGADRSGTSLLAGLLHRWGAFGGDPGELTRGDDFNPRGYYENKALERFIDGLFAAIAVPPWNASFPDRLRRKASDPEVRGNALRLVASMEEQSDVWFWKEPFLSLMLPFWQEILPEITYLITVRNPYDSARSWERLSLPPELRRRVSTVAAYLLRWQHFQLSILEGTETSRSKLFVAYERLIASPRQECERLADFLDRQCGERPGGLERRRAMVDLVDPDLRRQKSSPPFGGVQEATEEQKRLYELLQRKVDEPDAPFERSRYALYPGWREYLQNLAVLESVYSQAGSLLGTRSGRLLLALAKPLQRLEGWLFGRR